ncbi:hypothetical protein ACEUAI_12750 [Aeromonas veronii]|uniref:hypothetical protein n=1 Tax=Aeromonas hydrophila TaxID=644 RepID=UPI002B467B54|nr:hypothetical protein [Aeromonas hydrophila]
MISTTERIESKESCRIGATAGYNSILNKIVDLISCGKMEKAKESLIEALGNSYNDGCIEALRVLEITPPQYRLLKLLVEGKQARKQGSKVIIDGEVISTVSCINILASKGLATQNEEFYYWEPTFLGKIYIKHYP